MRGKSAAAVVGVVALCAGVGCGAPSARAPDKNASDDALTVNIAFPIEEMNLPNGLRVLLHREPSARSALVYVRYNVGSKDDPQGRSGFAHLYEHLMFLGSKDTKTKDYARWIAEVGGDPNAFTSREHTDYQDIVPPSGLPRALWLEADRMAYPLARLDEDAFGRERNVVKNEWRERYEDVPLGNLEGFAREAIFGAAHPYGAPNIGLEGELDRATLVEARLFAQKYYRPNNATLVVCGVFDPPSTKELINRYFATIPPGPIPPSRVIPPPHLAQERRMTVEAGIDGPAVMMAWPAPATEGDGYDELTFGLAVLRGGLIQRLTVEKQTANDVRCNYEAGLLGGFVTVIVKLKPGESTDTTIGVIDEYLAKTARLGRQYSWDHFKDLKTRALIDEISDLERLDGRARRILHDTEMHNAPNSMKIDLRRMLGVSSIDVGGAMEHFLIDSPRVVAVVTPTSGAPRSGRVVRR